MREPLITATLLSVYVGTRCTAKALGAIQAGFAVPLTSVRRSTV